MGKAKILIADDYNISAMVLPQLFELWGYEICEQVSSGLEAIEKAEKENPDVVLLDISLSGDISGIETARIIRSRFGIPVIFMTAYSDYQILEKAQHAAPSGYLVKPLDFYKLKSTINSIIQNDAGRRNTSKKSGPAPVWHSTVRG